MPRRDQRRREPPPSFRVVPNATIARALREIADGLDIEGQNPFRVRLARDRGAKLVSA